MINNIKNNVKIVLLISIALGQYDYSLIDLNPSSDTYENTVGVSYFEGKITLNYFGHFT
tara:strand:+ start:2222 stop:2398 length:177 start_codon:yes stop_codon:yes gene_type:complete